MSFKYWLKKFGKKPCYRTALKKDLIDLEEWININCNYGDFVKLTVQNDILFIDYKLSLLGLDYLYTELLRLWDKYDLECKDKLKEMLP